MKMEINKIYQGDCLDVLKTLPDESVNCVMTSPPYWALRDYGVGGQLGLEPTFQEYINKLCDVFDEVKRVLRKDGTCWVNLGDTYNAGGNYRGKELGDGSKEVYRRKDFEGCQNDKKAQGIEAKSLCNIPARFSIEMQNRGWILRNKIIWHKPNCMPSSVKDRFTVDFEEIFFFVKSKNYWFETQYEPHQNPKDVKYRKELRLGKGYNTKKPYNNNIPYSVQPRNKEIVEYRNLPDLKEFSCYINDKRKKLKYTIDEIENLHNSQTPHHWFNGESYPTLEDYKWLKELFNLDNKYDKQMTEIFTKSSEKTTSDLGRNKRTVWTITTKPFKEAHFAVYPETLCETPIKAGCPVGGVVLDPFCGAGTTGLVALKQNKQFIGIELNPEYIEIANKRLKPYLEQTNITKW
jgi:DNA modification methylase